MATLDDFMVRARMIGSMDFNDLPYLLDENTILDLIHDPENFTLYMLRDLNL